MTISGSVARNPAGSRQARSWRGAGWRAVVALAAVRGHSQGGTYAPLIAKQAPQVAGVILLAAGAEQIGTALLRQVRYLATLPGTIGANAKAELPDIAQEVAEIDNPAQLKKDPPGTVLLGGAGPAYYLSGFAYNEVATARSIPQPLLLLQGDRDYQAAVTNDLDVWIRGLRGRTRVTVVQFPDADHLFLDGTGPPTPLEYQKPATSTPGSSRPSRPGSATSTPR